MYEGRSWTKCSTRRFVVAFPRFLVPLWRFVMSYRRIVVSSFRHVVSSFRHTDAPGRFVVSSRLLFRRFVVSSCRFVVSTRALRETIIRLTLHEVLPISRGFRARPLYM